MPKTSKWAKYNDQINDLVQKNLSPSDIASTILNSDKHPDKEALRRYVSSIKKKIIITNESLSETKNYKEDVDESALKEYCRKERIDYNQVQSAKFLGYKADKPFNIVLKPFEEEIDWKGVWSKAKEEVESQISSIKKGTKRKWRSTIKRNREGVVKISDLHIGSLVSNLVKTQEYTTDILTLRLETAAQIINNHNYSKVHIHIHGDILETFTGLNHRNSWKSLETGMIGANVVKIAVEILHKFFLNRITSPIGEVKIVAGNHDRVTSNKDEDESGDAANLISWGLSLLGYNTEFNPLIISHRVGGINYLILHGDRGLNKRQTKEIVWDYGKQGIYNFIAEGHLHSRIKKLSAKSVNKFEIISDDSIDCQRRVLPSLFTGNFYSESNLWFTNPGFIIIEDNGEGKPNIFDYSL